MTTAVQPPPASAGDWPATRQTHPFDYGDDGQFHPPAPEQVLASINEICTGWKARRFGSRYTATLRGADFSLSVWADDVHKLAGLIAKANAGRLV
jgi:hypothetical protein